MLTALTFLIHAIPFGPSATAEALPATASSEAAHFELLKYNDRVERDGSQVRTIEVRVRLGTAQGVAEFGQIGLPYVDGYADVQFEDVVIEKADGRRVEVKNGLVEDVNPFGVTGTSLPADVRFKRLTIPGLEPGDGLSYRIVNRLKPLARGRAFGEMKLPPVPGAPLQTYELDVPRQSGIKVRLRDGLGAPWEEVSSAPDRLVRRLLLKVELPAERGQPTAVGRQRWIEPDVIFTNFSSWAEVSGWWWELSKDRLKPDAAVAKEASVLTGSARTPREKVGALHAFVATRIRYLNVSFGIGRMQPHPAAEVLQNRYGDCKDKHALLAALAGSLSIDVRPVLINSARTDLRDDVPGPQQFDHMISVVRLGPSPSDWLWLDGTNPFGGPGYLLPSLRDKRALLIEANGEGLLVRTPNEPPFVARQEVSLKGTLDAEGVLRGRVTWLFRSDAEVAFRALFSAAPQERRTSAIKESMAGDWGEVTVENVSVSDPLNVTSPFRVEFDAVKKIPAKGSERSLSVPLPEFELREPASHAPVGEPAVTFSVREVRARAEIEIPEGHRARLPLSVSLDRPFGTFRSVYSVDGRILKLERTLALSRPSLAEADVAAYQSFRGAITTDRKQEFTIEGTASAQGVPTAEGLRTDGLAAFEKKDYAGAVELLQKATEADPKTKDGFEDLGRALHELGRNEDALAAFTRQIEITPFHETAYAWRAYVLGRLDRWPDAEKDLLKQIEVAPFKAWSYERLGERRLLQQRYAEATDFYARAAAVEPKVAQRWVDLAAAQAGAGRPGEARKSLEQGAALDLPDWIKIRAAGTYRLIGDPAKAAELAQAALPSLSGRLAGLLPQALQEGDVYWVDRLVEAWRFVGEGAAAAGDLAKAERYLEAAWRLVFSPEAAWALGDLREKQGRLADAVELWSMAASVPSAAVGLPRDRQARIEAACRKLPDTGRTSALPSPGAASLATPTPRAKPPRQAAAEARLMEQRTIRLVGPVLADLTEEILLLADADGRVERVLNLSRKNSKALDLQVAKLGTIHLAWPRPDQERFKAVRRGLLACSTATGCALVLDLPGLQRLPSKDPGSIRILRLDPKEGTELASGQRVTLTAAVRYNLSTDQGTVALVIQDEAGKSLIEPSPAENVVGRTGEATLTGTFTVPAKATRIDVLLPLYTSQKLPTTIIAATHYAVKLE
jgi:tetratricopeptide (TPR) repeat protein